MNRQGFPDGLVLLLGGRSEVGLEVAQRLAPGRAVVLAARRSDDLSEQIALLRSAGATDVYAVELDADRTERHVRFLDELTDRYGRIGIAVVAFGILGDQTRAEADPTHAVQIAQTDYVAQVSILLTLANVMKVQEPLGGRRGAIVAFSSVAGVRVRKANFVYGSTKAGLDGFVQGLTDSLHGTGVQVLLARPGFIVGAMTRDLMASGVKPAPFSKTAPQVADATVRRSAAGAAPYGSRRSCDRCTRGCGSYRSRCGGGCPDDRRGGGHRRRRAGLACPTVRGASSSTRR